MARYPVTHNDFLENFPKLKKWSLSLLNLLKIYGLKQESV